MDNCKAENTELCSNAHLSLQTRPQHITPFLHGGVDESLTQSKQYTEVSTAVATGKGMSSDRKRTSADLRINSDIAKNNTSIGNTAETDNTDATLPGRAKESPRLQNKKRRVSFCSTTNLPPSPSTIKFRSTLPNIMLMHSVSCTSLPQLSSSSSSVITNEGTSSTGELDLNVSPAAFVKTIVLQSKSITKSIRGEDVISHASELVKQDSYYLEYTHEHLEAYTTDKVSAVQCNDIETLRSLHKSGHLIQASNRFGESLLHTSCRRGFTDMVDFFINEAKMSPRVRDDMGRTPMHDACWSSCAPNHDIMKILIGAAPELLLSKDKRGHSPFDYARREYWPNWVAFLNEHRQFIVNSLVTSCFEDKDQITTNGSEDYGGVICTDAV